MVVDVAKWLTDLLRTKWDLAVEDLRSDGVTFPKIIKPQVQDRSKASAVVRLNNSVTIKVFQDGQERSAFPYWGARAKDTQVDWAIDIQAEHPDAARDDAYAAKQIVERILELHRKGPEPDWDVIEKFAYSQEVDYFDYQHGKFTLTLMRHARIAATAIQDRGVA